MVGHLIEYSKSSRAKCHGRPPCKGSNIEAGALRYGKVLKSDYGDTVEWRHWGCVTPDILTELAVLPVDDVSGLKSLKIEDQHKIRRAVAIRQIDPADIPASAKPSPATQAKSSGGAPSQKKRRAAFEASQTATSSKSFVPSTSAVRTVGIDLTQNEELEDDAPDEESRDELYCTMGTSIVGVQYYKGLVGHGEEVRLVREPQNRYDRNAIQVKNISGIQVGHIPRQTAASLAPLLDEGLVTVEGVMRDGNLSGFSYSLSMTLKIYGAADKRAQLEPRLIWATPARRGFAKRNNAPTASTSYQTPARGSSSIAGASVAPPPSMSTASQQRGMTAAQIQAQQEAARKQQEAWQKAQELQQMLNTLEKVDDEGRRSSLLDTLCSQEDILSFPEHPSPPGINTGDLKVNLLKHQSQALKWCLEKEYPVLPKKESDKPVQFWQLRKAGARSFYFNVATKTPQEAPPVLGRGALVADSMGLGKTLTMLALILDTRQDIPPEHSKSTLIVVPLSVLSNWEKQIQDHVVEGALRYYVYYGASRSITPDQLKQFDVVITTYQVVTKEHAESGSPGATGQKRKRSEKGLFDVPWKRIILDEGHSIRNPRTKMAKAVCGLDAHRRWVLSGTPIINSPRDLGSILTFLRICRPMDNEDFFKRLLLRPLKDGSPSGAELLRALMSQICIRRTKEMRDSEGNYLVPLPPVEMIMVPVTLHEDAKTLYDAVDEVSRQRVERFMDREGGLHGVAIHSNVLSMLTRLRQLALHPGLVPADYLEQLRSADAEDEAPPAVVLTSQDRLRLQSRLFQAIEDNEECPICFGVLSDPRITSCGHSFCLTCISEVISRDPKCPMDRRPITMGDLVEPPPPTDLTQAPVSRDEDDDDSELRKGSSAKIDQLVHLLKLTPSTEKSLVFSQFTTFLDKIGDRLAEEGISFVRFDGKMSAKRRQETLERFSVPIDEDSPEETVASTTSQAAPQSTHRRRQTRRKSTAPIVLDSDPLTGQDDDFVPDNNDDDVSFAEDDSDEEVARNSRKKGKGKGKARASTRKAGSSLVNFDGPNPKVMLISLKAGALGLNLTVANNVYLMDPWWQEGIESQAIDRVNRIGQKKPVHVYQLIAENTVESKVIDIQERKKKLIKEAFAGIKSNETQRQKKEAKLQELVELFGLRQQTAKKS
ncbi:hypothetical protein NEOLEDRAFT_1142558 [Neolentinus lepideus HHB14362 ss-1]|uniref:SNF2 family DNA-dependent ATPase domain-containing protein n=1 Tax=Neolentinus lepideus HHB14362 ss-1 TaxID=1314782 RepID=A0A165N1K7_9AGAM|nr:hypothetical protein NEOLEDRAFT_1142558 [Neolentinus lepideus HHB14362 ss-1]